MMNPIWLLVGLLVFTVIWTISQLLAEHRRYKKALDGEIEYHYYRDLFGSTGVRDNPKHEYPVIRVITDDWEYEERLGRPGRSS